MVELRFKIRFDMRLFVAAKGVKVEVFFWGLLDPVPILKSFSSEGSECQSFLVTFGFRSRAVLKLKLLIIEDSS